MKFTPNNIMKEQNSKFNPNDIELNVENRTNNADSLYNETFAGKDLLPLKNTELKKEDEDSFSSAIKKNNLLFEEKSVSFVKLYLHLSNRCEIILMILGTVAALGSGVAAPLMCYLFGDMANDFSAVNGDDSTMALMEDLLNCRNEEEVFVLAKGNTDMAFTYIILYRQAKALFESFDDEVDKMVTKLMIIGASMFIAFGLSKFLWNYVGMRQMHHLKEKYFSLILRQEQGWFDANNAFEFRQKFKHNLNKLLLVLEINLD